MAITSAISNILGQKSSHVWSVSPDTVVLDAIRLMSEKDVGALPVVEGDQLVGVLSERDYTRKVILKGRSSKDTSVRDIMASPPITATPSDTVDSCMRTMTHRRVRHLPVVDGGKLVGIISIGDLVNWLISAQGATIDQLKKFITGEYPA